MAVHTYSPSTWEAEVGGLIPGQSHLSEVPSQKQAGWMLGVSCRYGYKTEISATNSEREFMPGSSPKWKAILPPLKPRKIRDISSAVQVGRKKGHFQSVGLDCQVPSAFIKSRHREGPGKLFHLLPEFGQTLTCFWIVEQEGFEILELGWEE